MRGFIANHTDRFREESRLLRGKIAARIASRKCNGESDYSEQLRYFYVLSEIGTAVQHRRLSIKEAFTH